MEFPSGRRMTSLPAWYVLTIRQPPTSRRRSGKLDVWTLPSTSSTVFSAGLGSVAAASFAGTTGGVSLMVVALSPNTSTVRKPCPREPWLRRATLERVVEHNVGLLHFISTDVGGAARDAQIRRSTLIDSETGGIAAVVDRRTVT